MCGSGWCRRYKEGKRLPQGGDADFFASCLAVSDICSIFVPLSGGNPGFAKNRSIRLTVRTADSHSANTSSILVWSTEAGAGLLHPAIAYQKPETDTFLHADMVVEGFEEVDMTFLQRVYERHFNIPWTILETERCIVRELELSDLDDLFSMYAEPGMTDYMEGLYEYEEELEYQKAYIENMYRFYGYGMWLVFEKKTGTLIGRAGVEHREELNGDMELGYAIRTSFQHQGYAYEVCQAIMQYAGEELQVGSSLLR